VSGELALQHLPPTRRAGGKPFQIEGLNADSGEWELPRPGQRYGEFQAGLQMANRSGALNEIEYSEFVQKIQPFADALGATVDFPDMLDVVARARELDAFASQHDAQLGAVLRANSVAWSVGPCSSARPATASCRARCRAAGAAVGRRGRAAGAGAGLRFRPPCPTTRARLRCARCPQPGRAADGRGR
jgi:hypothetical protein